MKVRRKDISFMAFMKTKLFEIYLVTWTMSLNSLKDSMSLQMLGNFESNWVKKGRPAIFDRLSYS